MVYSNLWLQEFLLLCVDCRSQDFFVDSTKSLTSRWQRSVKRFGSHRRFQEFFWWEKVKVKYTHKEKHQRTMWHFHTWSRLKPLSHLQSRWMKTGIFSLCKDYVCHRI